MTRYARVTTDKLKFAVGIGRAGLKIWKGQRLAEVKKEVEEMERELESRANIERGNEARNRNR